MTDFKKAHVFVEGDDINFGVPFSKVDVKNRTVEGFATLDNVDKSDEVVDAKASEEAFRDWIGNVREMHHPSAVGKAIQIEGRQYTDPDTGKTYNGVHVRSKISKGAEDAWQKILDGTYSGYSIGGKVLERVPDVIKGDDGTFSQRNVSRITKYHLGELSVVDNPMNGLATFDAIGKADGVTTLIKNDNGELKPDAALAEPKNLFYCEPCELLKVSDIDKTQADCSTCEKAMTNIGEVTESPKLSDIQKMVTAHLTKAAVRDVRRDPIEIDGVEYEMGVWPEHATAVAEMYAYPEEADNTNENDSATKSGIESEDVVVNYDRSPDSQLTTPKLPEGSPQTAAKADALDVQTAEGEDFPLELLRDKILETLKSNVKYTGSKKKRLYKDEDLLFIDTMLNFEAKDFEDTDQPAVLKAQLVTYNQAGTREKFGISMSDYAALGKALAYSATEELESEHQYQGGYVVGPSVDSVKEAAELIVDLQKNSSDDNNDVVSVLQRLFSTLRKSESDTKGGETKTLDPKEIVTKILDTLTTATREMEEVVKGWNVEALNDENAAGSAVGGGNDGGVGAEGATGAVSADDVTRANTDGLSATDGGSEKVVPNKIEVSGTGADPGTTQDAGPEKVLPHADLPATSASGGVRKAEGSDDSEDDKLAKAVAAMDGFVTKIEELNTRLDSVENSGGVKKSAEIEGDDLKKSEEAFWGGQFYSSDPN